MVMFRRDLGTFARNLEQVVEFIDQLDITPDQLISITVTEFDDRIPQIMLSGKKLLSIMNSDEQGMKSMAMFGFVRGIQQEIAGEPDVRILRIRFQHFEAVAVVRKEDLLSD